MMLSFSYARHRLTVLRLGWALALAPFAVGAQEPAPATKVCAGGDVTLGTNLDTSWTRLWERRLGRPVDPLPASDSLVEPLRPLVMDADIVLVNVEGAIGEGRAPPKCGRRSRLCYAMRSPAAAARALRNIAGDTAVVVVGNVANNHAGDAGLAGRRETLDHLREAGVLVTGADTLATVAVTARGDTVAILGFATSAATPDARDYAAVRRHVRRAAQAYGRVIVTMHLGSEGGAAQRTRNREERLAGERRGNPIAFARAAQSGGARLVVGHGPHVVRALEWREGTLTAYSLGNLVTYGPFSFKAPNDRAAVLCATLDDAGAVQYAELRSTVQHPPGLVAWDPTNRAAALADSLGRLDFPRTGARISVDGRIAPPDSTAHIGVRKERQR